MTDNSELEAAIDAGLLANDELVISLMTKDSKFNQDLLLVSENGQTAFTAYRERFHALEAENVRLREALLPFAAIYAAYQRDYNSEKKASLCEFVGEELNWFKMWMHHDGYKLALEADYQQAAAMTEEATE